MFHNYHVRRAVTLNWEETHEFRFEPKPLSGAIMNSAAFRIFTFLALCVAVAAQDSSYYEAIQKGAATQVQPNQF
jgi:hypothetical protein